MENEVDSGSNQFTTMDWSPMGANEIALGTDGSSIEIWDINQRGLKAEIMLRDEQISSLAYSPFHPSILGLLGSAGIQILDLRQKIESSNCSNHDFEADSGQKGIFKFSNKNLYEFAISQGRQLYVLDIRYLQHFKASVLNSNEITDFDFHPKLNQVAVSDDSGSISIYRTIASKGIQLEMIYSAKAAVNFVDWTEL